MQISEQLIIKVKLNAKYNVIKYSYNGWFKVIIKKFPTIIITILYILEGGIGSFK